MKRREQLTRWERLYLGEVLRGLVIVNTHFIRNLALHIAHAMGFAKERKAATTVQYPDERKTYSDGYRGSHRLTLRPDDSVRCTSCFLCATACPAQCIYIEAGAHPDPAVEKFPLRYEIDTLRCIYCGLCVEACPCDAIRMDTYVHPRIWGFDRKDFVETKEQLMHRSRVLAAEGREGNMREMFQWYDEQSREVYNPMRPELKTYSERERPPAWKDDGTGAAPAIPAIDRHDLRHHLPHHPTGK